MTSFLSRRAFLLVPLGLLLIAAVYGACTPGSEITVAESDVVLTLFDKDFNFGAVKTYAMPDSIYHFTGDPDTSGPAGKYDQDMLALIESNFEKRGYTRVADPGTTTPDFSVVVAAVETETWNVYSYYPWNPWYPWYPYWGWYYPPYYGTSYAFTLGTLIIQMGEFAENPPDDEAQKTAYWYAAANGVLDDTEKNLVRRFTDSINQAFDQSPYLKSEQ
jgi:hypothetical protein